MSLRSIEKRARDGTLEVEHLLKEAAYPNEELARLLDALRVELHWQAPGETDGANRTVPLAAWAQVLAAYCREGYPGLARLAGDPVLAQFVIRLLEELKTKEALDTLRRAFRPCFDAPDRDTELAFCIAGALNFMLSFKPAVEVEPAEAAALQAFVIRLYAYAQRDAERAKALLALRGIGDVAAAEFAASKHLAAPWDKVPQLVSRHIRKRM